VKYFLSWFLCVGFLRLNFGGGGSSSASMSTTNNLDKRLVVGDSALGITSDNSTLTLNMLDAGAIKGALDTVNMSNSIAGDGYARLISAAENMFNTSQGLIGQTQKSVADAYSIATTDKAGTIDNRTIIVLAVAGAAALFAFRK
jgi:hypothetical protein